jgi:hypothetical protein
MCGAQYGYETDYKRLQFSAVESCFSSLVLYFFIYFCFCIFPSRFFFVSALSSYTFKPSGRPTYWTANARQVRRRTWKFEAHSGFGLQRRAWSLKMQGNPYVGHWNTAFVSHSKWFIPLSNSSAKEYGLLCSVRLPASLWCWRNMSFLVSREHTDIQTGKNFRHL